MHTNSLVVAAVGIAACPTIWNIVAQNEYRRHTLERLMGGKRRGCYALAAWIFLSSLYRDKLFEVAVRNNLGLRVVPNASASVQSALKAIAGLLFGAGMTLVCSAFYRLGITGTYLGDYFGILMEERVTAFPFSLVNNPMYLGSTMSFLSIALYHNSLVGVGLSAWVHLVYWVSTTYYEGPFTAKIYANASSAKKKASNKNE